MKSKFKLALELFKKGNYIPPLYVMLGMGDICSLTSDLRAVPHLKQQR